MSSGKHLRVFNQNQTNKKGGNLVRKGGNLVRKGRNRGKGKGGKRLVKTGSGAPYESVKNPSNGLLYVDSDTGDTYLFVAKLGWVNQSSWQPDVGEGPPVGDWAPEDPMSGDQYVDVISGDFYYYSEGFGWVMMNGVEGPQGVAGESFSFELVTSVGATGPVVTGPFQVKAGSRVKLWVDSTNGMLCGDVTP